MCNLEFLPLCWLRFPIKYLSLQFKALLSKTCHSVDAIILLNIHISVPIPVLFCCTHAAFLPWSYSWQCLHRAFPTEPSLCWAVSWGGPRAYLRGGGRGWRAKLWPTGELWDTHTNETRVESVAHSVLWATNWASKSTWWAKNAAMIPMFYVLLY